MTIVLQTLGGIVLLLAFGLPTVFAAAAAWHDARDRWRTMRADRSAARHHVRPEPRKERAL